MKQTSQIYLIILCAGLFGLQTFAQNSPVKNKKDDLRVEKALKQIKSEYERDQDGNYEVTYQTTGSRRQTVFVSPDTGKPFDSEVRLIFSLAQISDQPQPLDVTTLLLEQNMENPSYWAILKTSAGKNVLVNLMYIPADADGKTLDAALSVVTLAADKMEEQLTKRDVY